MERCSAGPFPLSRRAEIRLLAVRRYKCAVVAPATVPRLLIRGLAINRAEEHLYGSLSPFIETSDRPNGPSRGSGPGCVRVERSAGQRRVLLVAAVLLGRMDWARSTVCRLREPTHRTAPCPCSLFHGGAPILHRGTAIRHRRWGELVPDDVRGVYADQRSIEVRGPGGACLANDHQQQCREPLRLGRLGRLVPVGHELLPGRTRSGPASGWHSTLRLRRQWPLVGLALVCLLALASCGNESRTASQSDAVAVVDDTAIPLEKFRRWSSVFGGPGAKRAKASTERTMEFLIYGTWIRLEAKQQGTRVSEREIGDAVAQHVARLKTGGGLERYLRSSGMTERDLRDRIGLDVLRQALQHEIVGEAAPSSSRQILRYYRRHQPSFRVPAQRDIQLVVTRSRLRADEARQRLARGQRWRDVTTAYSIDRSRKRGGLMTFQTDNTNDRIKEVVFGSEPGKITGPVRMGKVWWTFRVVASRAPRRRPLAEARPRIRSILRSRAEEQALAKLVATLKAKYRPRTSCAPRYTISLCGETTA